MEELIAKLEETGLFDKRLLESFDVIQIIAMIDEEYDITVPPSQIMPQNFNSAAAIYDMIQRLGDE